MEYDYKVENDHEFFNQYDPDLGGRNGEYAIKVKLPTLESFFASYNLPREELLKLVEGYGLEPKLQKFDYYRDTLQLFTTPDKITSLITELTEELTKAAKTKKNIAPTVEQIFDAIEENPNDYEDEIVWMKIQKKRWIQGYWFFINGKVTYIDGNHYVYLMGWAIANPHRIDGLPFFRDVDRRVFHFFKWSSTTKEAFFKYKLTGRANGIIDDFYFNKKKSMLMFIRKHKMQFYEEEEGDFLVETNQRTCAGVPWAARRGGGKTYIMGLLGVMGVIPIRNGRFAIQARSETTGKDDVYTEKVKIPFESLPFFFKPCNRVREDKILFYPDKAGALSNTVKPHYGRVFTRSSKMTAIDGNRNHRYGSDESGKDESGNVLKNHTDTVRETLSISGEIIGWAMYFSTFGAFEKGGKAFFDLFKASMRHKCTDIGRTQTWLFALFTPGFDGFDMCVDEFGYSIIEDPIEPYTNIKGDVMRVGAKTYLMAERDYAKDAGDWDTYNKLVRNYSFNIREASRPAQNSNSWDMEVLNKRVEYLQIADDAPKPRNVNARWEQCTDACGWPCKNGHMFVTKEVNGKLVRTTELSNVKLVEPRQGEIGKFNIYRTPPDNARNKKIWDAYNCWWGPDPSVRDLHVLGTDPFAFDKDDVRSSGKTLSDGSGIMFQKRDRRVDPDDALIKIWQTNKIAATYLNRPDTKDEYAEDMLMIAILYGSMVSTETNVPLILERFRKWKVWGYILYLTDPVTGFLNDKPGVSTQGQRKQTLLTTVRDHVKYHGAREDALEVLEQIMNVESPDDLTQNDHVAALGCALMGAESRHIESLDEISDVLDLSHNATF